MEWPDTERRAALERHRSAHRGARRAQARPLSKRPAPHRRDRAEPGRKRSRSLGRARRSGHTSFRLDDRPDEKRRGEDRPSHRRETDREDEEEGPRQAHPSRRGQGRSSQRRGPSEERGDFGGACRSSSSARYLRLHPEPVLGDVGTAHGARRDGAFREDHRRSRTNTCRADHP